MSETGRLISVSKTTLGTTLALDATTGAGLITLTDTSDFDEGGGTLSLGGVQYVYGSLDPDAGVVTLSGTLSADAAEGDRVDVWDTGLAAVAVEGRALVALPGDLANDEPVDADIAHSLLPYLDTGLRVPGTEEAVVMERRGDSWTVIDVRGKQPVIQPAYVPAGGGITAWGYFTLAFTDPGLPAGGAGLSGEVVTFDDDGSDPGFFAPDTGGTPGIDILTDGVYIAHVLVLVRDCDQGDVFQFRFFGSPFAAAAGTVTADSSGNAEWSGTCSIFQVAGSAGILQLSVGQDSGTGVAPTLADADVQINKIG